MEVYLIHCAENSEQLDILQNVGVEIGRAGVD